MPTTNIKFASDLSPEAAAQVGAVGIQIVLAKVFHNEDALRSYLKLHPKADPSKHSVKGKPSKDKKEKGDDKTKGKDKKPGLKDLSGEPGFSALKGMSPEKQREVIEKALEMGKPKEKQKKTPKDHSDKPGFSALKGLSPREQRKVIERALKMASQNLSNLSPTQLAFHRLVRQASVETNPTKKFALLRQAKKVASQHLAAEEWVAWLEDKDGHMVAFSGATSQSQAKKLQKSPKWSKVVDEGGEVTVSPLDRAVKRHLKPASKAWFSKLPSGDKAKLDAVLKKVASSRLVQISGNLFAENGTSQIGDRIDMIHLRPKAVSDRDLKGATSIIRKGGKWFLKMYSGPLLPLQEASYSPSGVWMSFYLLGEGESHPRALTAQGYRIGPGGLEKPDKGITLQPNTVYWMGASSSPSMIIVTKVTDDSIEYMNPYDKQKRKIQRWIGEDLIMQGSKRWLDSYAKYQPEMAKSIRSMLNGGPGKKENLRDWDRVRITVRAKDPSQDLWREAERYGNVAGIDADDGVMLYEIEGFRGSVEKVKKDSRFKVESEKKIGSRSKSSGTAFKNWWDMFREGYGKSNGALRQLEGFFHYRLFDRDGKNKMDGTPVLTPQEVAAAQKSYAKLKKIEKAYEEAWKHIRDFERDVRSLDDYMGYT